MNEKEKAEASFAQDEKFDAVFAGRAIKIQERRQRSRVIKHAIFWTLFVLYYYLFFVRGYGQFFAVHGDVAQVGGGHLGSSLNSSPGDSLLIFIFAAVCIWLPMDILERIGLTNVGSSGSGGTTTPVPAIALRFFGWVIYVTPTIFYILYRLLV